MLTDKDLEELRQERRADYLAEAARDAASQAQDARESVGDQEPGQELQAGAVGGPGLVAIGGDATVAVQVYALGRGIVLPGEPAHLGLGEGAFELEAHGVGLVVDPVGAAESHRLVTPIERYPLAVWPLVEAVDQEELAEFGLGLGHGHLQAKTAIVNLPPGAGKTLLGRQLAARLGCAWVVDDWADGRPLLAGGLHLTHLPVREMCA